MMTVRILHIADFAAPYPGAIIRQLVMLDEEVRSAGAEATAFIFPEAARERAWVNLLRERGCDVRFVPATTPRLHRDIAGRLEQLIGEIAPSVVHTHFGTYDLSTTYAVKRLQRSSMPDLKLVWHYRTALEEPLGERSVGRRIKDYLKFARAGRAVDVCCAVTDALADEVAARGMGARARGVVAGCDTDTFRADPAVRERVRAELGIANDQLLLLHLGWHWHRKGGDLLAAATRELAARGHTNIVAASVGAPADELEAPVIRLEPTDRIHELQAAGDIFISASRSEGFGNGLVEAMACERVAAAALVDGQREVFDGLDGCVACTPGDAHSLADAIETLIARRDDWATLGAANRARVVERHSMRRWARDMADVYREIGVPLGDAGSNATGMTGAATHHDGSTMEVA